MNRLREHEKVKQDEPRLKRPGRNFFTILFSGEWVAREKAVEILPFVFFVAFLAMIYIADRQYAEGVARAIHHSEKELKELRWEYITAKAELMHLSKQTEVAEKAAAIGLQESVVPPVKIILTEEDTEKIISDK